MPDQKFLLRACMSHHFKQGKSAAETHHLRYLAKKPCQKASVDNRSSVSKTVLKVRH
ncbi:unnamed protein product [Haemonchus placei]|uniref:Orphan protein n=1 Tax=Haemonchus placei TaxID=6290 RepID=A0A0N4WJX2_HAEPC|nr:unnamed protein product [Haemonchus placei]